MSDARYVGVITETQVGETHRFAPIIVQPYRREI
jgi:hypothetical protein